MTDPGWRIKWTTTRVMVSRGKVAHILSHLEEKNVLGSFGQARCGTSPVWYSDTGWLAAPDDMPVCKRCAP